jgi:hypothetical protein
MHLQLEVEYPPEFQQLQNEIKQKTKLKLLQDIGYVRAIEDKYSIDYEPQSIFELDAFHLFLMEEARLQKIYLWNTWGLLCIALKLRLVAEKSLDFLLSSMDHVISKNDALYFIWQVIPCI